MSNLIAPCRKSVLLSLLTLLLASTSWAKDSPETVAQAYFTAMKTEGLLSSTRFMHPSALLQFKTMLMPVYVAEHNAGGRQLLDVTFSETIDFAQLEAMDPAKFMDGFMQLVVAQTGDVPLHFDKLEVLGTIDEGDVRHVLTRMTLGAGDLALTQMEVLSFIPYQETWLLQLSGDMKGLASALRSQIPQPAEAN